MGYRQLHPIGISVFLAFGLRAMRSLGHEGLGMAYSRDTCPEYHSLSWVWALYLCLGTSILGLERKRKQYRGGKKDEPGSDINSGGHEALHWMRAKSHHVKAERIRNIWNVNFNGSCKALIVDYKGSITTQSFVLTISRATVEIYIDALAPH